jgi:hypothetical protein
MNADQRQITVADNAIALASVGSLLALFLGAWPNSQQLLYDLLAAQSLGMISDLPIAFWELYSGIGTLVFGMLLAVICLISAVFNLFSVSVRSMLRPGFWLVVGILGLVEPVVATAMWNLPHNGLVPLEAWGVYVWLGCYLIIIGAAANKLASRSI